MHLVVSNTFFTRSTKLTKSTKSLGSRRLDSLDEFYRKLQSRLPYNSSTQRPWTTFAISRVLFSTITRGYDPDCPRDMQFLFVQLLKQRSNDKIVQYNLDQLIEQELAVEQAQEQA